MKCFNGPHIFFTAQWVDVLIDVDPLPMVSPGEGPMSSFQIWHPPNLAPNAKWWVKIENFQQLYFMILFHCKADTKPQSCIVGIFRIYSCLVAGCACWTNTITQDCRNHAGLLSYIMSTPVLLELFTLLLLGISSLKPYISITRYTSLSLDGLFRESGKSSLSPSTH
jgi:hypothetical protein